MNHTLKTGKEKPAFSQVSLKRFLQKFKLYRFLNSFLFSEEEKYACLIGTQFRGSLTSRLSRL